MKKLLLTLCVLFSSFILQKAWAQYMNQQNLPGDPQGDTFTLDNSTPSNPVYRGQNANIWFEQSIVENDTTNTFVTANAYVAPTLGANPGGGHNTSMPGNGGNNCNCSS